VGSRHDHPRQGRPVNPAPGRRLALRIGDGAVISLLRVRDRAIARPDRRSGRCLAAAPARPLRIMIRNHRGMPVFSIVGTRRHRRIRTSIRQQAHRDGSAAGRHISPLVTSPTRHSIRIAGSHRMAASHLPLAGCGARRSARPLLATTRCARSLRMIPIWPSLPRELIDAQRIAA
jgi:hypothetical protein